MIRHRRAPDLRCIVAAALAPLVAGLALAHQVAAQPPDLVGSWSGGGSVSFGGGAREAARCRAHYTRTSSRSYLLNATCATPSGRASQTATLRHAGGGTFHGSFFNREYNVTGRIFVVVRGGRQTVRLSSDFGSALFELRR